MKWHNTPEVVTGYRIFLLDEITYCSHVGKKVQLLLYTYVFILCYAQ